MPPKLSFESNPDPNYYGGKPISFSNSTLTEHKKDNVHHKKIDTKKVIPEFSSNNKELLDLKNHTKVNIKSDDTEHSGKDELPNVKDLGEAPSQPTIMSRVAGFIDNPLGVDSSKNMETEARLERQGREVVSGTQAVNQVKNDLIDKPTEAVVDSAKILKDTLDKGLENISNFGNNVMLVGGAVLLLYLLKN